MKYVAFVLSIFLFGEANAQRNMPQLLSIKSRQVSANNSGSIWQVGINFTVSTYKNTWQNHPSKGTARSVFIAENNDVYIIGYDNIVYKSTGLGWNKITSQDTKATQVCSDSNGKVWIIGLNKHIYWLSENKEWIEYHADARAKNLLIDARSNPIHIGLDNHVYIRENNQWKTFANDCPKAKKITFDAQGRLWIIDDVNNNIYYQKANKWLLFSRNIRARDIAFAHNTLLYIDYWNNNLYAIAVN